MARRRGGSTTSMVPHPAQTDKEWTMRLVPFVLAAALVAGAGCKSSDSPPAAAAPAGAPGAAPAGGASGAAALPPDPGPLLACESGVAKADRQPQVTVKAESAQKEGGHTYVTAPLPPELTAALTAAGQGAEELRALLPPSVKGAVAVEATAGGTADARLVLRLVGDAAAVDVTVAKLPDRWTRFLREPWTLRTVRVEGIAEAAAGKDLAKRFYGAMSAFFQRWDDQGWGQRSPFASFAAGRMARMGGRDDATGAALPLRRFNDGDVAETMSLYTGMTSIQEALQTDRGLRATAAAAERTIPLEELKAVPLASHPWDAMMKTLGKAPVMEPLASVVPSTMMYVHFRDLRVAVRLANDLGGWLQPAAEVLEGNTGTGRITERYEAQLVVERTGLAEKLGHLAADGVAFIAGDPFFREGTDVAMLFEIKNETLLTTAFAGFEAAARGRRADIAESTYELEGRTVRVLSTPDRAIHQHRVKLGDVLVLANSRATIEKLVAVADGKARSLAESGDFKTFRTMDPYGEAEDGYAFLSDDFVAHVISPRTKVLASRRMLAAADLAAVGYAALLHGWLEGEAAGSAEALLAGGLVTAADLKHADGGAITLAGLAGPTSDAWGGLGNMRPLSELSVEKVTAAEKQAFEDFARTYQSYWRGTIDPIGIRITRSDDGRTVSLDGRMMPLIANSEYDELIRTVGLARVKADVIPSGIRWTFGVGDDASLRRDLDGLGRMVGRDDMAFGWLGTWVEVGALDRSGLWDLVLLDRTVPQPPEKDRKRNEAKTYEAIARMPIWVGAHVKSQVGLATTLTAIKAAIGSVAPDLVRFEDGGKHRDVSIVSIVPTDRARGPLGEPGLDKLALHYATPKDRIVLSLDKPTLMAAIDAALDDRGPTALDPKAKEGAQSVVTVATAGKESWLAKALLGALEAEARTALRGTFRDAEALLRGLPGTAPGSAEWEKAALGYLGTVPRSPHGGTFTVGAEGLPTHSIYGSEAEPQFPEIPVAGSPLSELVQSIERLTFGIAFEGEGDFRGLHATASWTRR